MRNTNSAYRRQPSASLSRRLVARLARKNPSLAAILRVLDEAKISAEVRSGGKHFQVSWLNPRNGQPRLLSVSRSPRRLTPTSAGRQ